MKGVYVLNEDNNMTLVAEVEDNDKLAPIGAVRDYLRQRGEETAEIRVASGGETIKAAGKIFHIVKL